MQLIFNLAIKLELSNTADALHDLLLTAWTSKLGSVGAQNRRSKAGQCSSAPACWIERLYCCDLFNLHRQVKETLKHATVLTCSLTLGIPSTRKINSDCPYEISCGYALKYFTLCILKIHSHTRPLNVKLVFPDLFKQYECTKWSTLQSWLIAKAE